MIQFTLRLPEELHEKLRLLAFKERRSQHAIVLELLEVGLRSVKLPEEEDRDERTKSTR